MLLVGVQLSLLWPSGHFYHGSFAGSQAPACGTARGFFFPGAGLCVQLTEFHKVFVGLFFVLEWIPLKWQPCPRMYWALPQSGITCKLDKVIAWRKMQKRAGPRIAPMEVCLVLSFIAVVFEELQSQLLIPDYKNWLVVVAWAYVLKKDFNTFFRKLIGFFCESLFNIKLKHLTSAKLILYCTFSLSVPMYF